MNSPARARRLVAVVAAALAASGAAGTGTAGAIVARAHPIDGPTAELTGDVDSAMAEDGTGGVAYLRQVDGRAHVFVARFLASGWRQAQRVDIGQDFDSSWVQLAAGDNGRLVVTWVQEFGVGTDRIYSATLDPGADGFRPPVPVDFNVGEATATYPDLAMNRGGQAYLVYNVITDTGSGNPPGYVGVDVRLARYGNRLWSVLSPPLDRNSAIPMRLPAPEIAPRVGIDMQGQGVAAWQEPDDEFVDRVWARRLFGSRVGIPLQASPSAWDGRPLRGRVDALSLDVAGFGQTAVAFRQQPGQAGALTAPRTMVNEMPDVFSEQGGFFGQAQIVDGTPQGALGPPSVAVEPRGRFISAFGSGGATLLGSGSDAGVDEPQRLDTGASSAAGDPVVDLAQTGAGVVAWRELRGGSGLVRVQERRADGVNESTTLSAPAGGGVGEISLSGSGLGDAVLAWAQGTGGGSQIAATVIDAPPDPFLVLLPSGWQNEPKIRIAWDRTLNAIGGVTYSVSVDDEPVKDGLASLETRLSRADVENGRHEVQVFAVDAAGQETGSLVGRLAVDRKAPRIRLERRRRGIVVSLRDGTRRSASGLRPATISFGDGERAKVKARGKRPTARVVHRYRRPGVYRVTAKANDRAGNRTRLRERVRLKR